MVKLLFLTLLLYHWHANKSGDFLRRSSLYAVRTRGLNHTFKAVVKHFMFSIIHKIKGIFKGSAVLLTAKTWNIDVIEYLKMLLWQISWHDKDGRKDDDSVDECANNTLTAMLSGHACICICTSILHTNGQCLYVRLEKNNWCCGPHSTWIYDALNPGLYFCQTAW